MTGVQTCALPIWKRWSDIDNNYGWILGKHWEASISLFFEGSPREYLFGLVSLSDLRGEIGELDDEIRLRLENEVEDIEFRLKLGSDLGR